jgi:hypothetical protein
MMATLATLVSHSLTGLSWLSPVEIFAVVAALSYGVGGLIALRIVEHRTAATRPRAPREATYKSAA